MKRKGYAFPIVFIIAGAVLLLTELFFLFLAVVFSLDGGHNTGNAVVMWACTMFFGVLSGGGIPFICIGISRAKAIKKYNKSIN